MCTEKHIQVISRESGVHPIDCKMSEKEDIFINLSKQMQVPPQLWNWTALLEHARNITKHNIEKHGYSDIGDDDVSSIVIVSIGIIMMIVMWIMHKYSKEEGLTWYKSENLDLNLL